MSSPRNGHPATRKSDAPAPPATGERVPRPKRFALLAITVLALVAWLVFLAMLAFRG